MKNSNILIRNIIAFKNINKRLIKISETLEGIQYRKKSVVIEVVQQIGTNKNEGDISKFGDKVIINYKT